MHYLLEVFLELSGSLVKVTKSLVVIHNYLCLHSNIFLIPQNQAAGKKKKGYGYHYFLSLRMYSFIVLGEATVSLMR